MRLFRFALIGLSAGMLCLPLNAQEQTTTPPVPASTPAPATTSAAPSTEAAPAAAVVDATNPPAAAKAPDAATPASAEAKPSDAAPPADAAKTPDTAAPADAAAAAKTPATTSVGAATPAPPSAVAKTPVAVAAKGGLFTHKTKEPYTGPTEIILLPPAPMLDEEGKQRMDTTGKLMFFPPVKQQRDKYGHPLFDEKGKPVFQTAKDLGYDEAGKKVHEEKEKPPKTTPVSISRGIYTVDGMAGKAALNYDIADLKYMYMFAPGIGIAVIAREPFPGATLQKGAFNDKLLSVTVEGHTLELANDKRLLGKMPEDAYVMLDRTFTLPSRSPVFGYGTTLKPPYAWPGAKPNQKIAGVVGAPPPPKNLVPTQLLSPCPAGQMRMPGPQVLPGETAPVQPCVPIPKTLSSQTKS